MIKFILNIFLIIVYLKVYSAQFNNRYILPDGTIIELIQSPIIDVVVEPQFTVQSSNLQHTTKLNGLTNKDNGQIRNQEIYSNQNQNSNIGQNQKYRTVQNQNTGNIARQDPNREYPNTGNTGSHFLNGGKQHTQNQNSQNFGRHQNQNTGVNAGHDLNIQTGQNPYQNTRNTGSQFVNNEKRYTQNQNAQNSGRLQNENTRLNAGQNPDILTGQKQYPYSNVGPYQNTGITGSQFQNGEKRFTQNQNSQNTGSHQIYNTGLIAGQNPNIQTGRNQYPNSKVGPYQNTGITGSQFQNGENWLRHTQNSQNTGSHQIHNTGLIAGQYPNIKTGQKQYPNSKAGPYQNTGNTGSQFQNGENWLKHTQNSQNSGSHQIQNTGLISGQNPNIQTGQKQYPNSKVGIYQNTGIIGSQFQNGEKRFKQNQNFQNTGSHQIQNTGINAGQNLNIQTGKKQNPNSKVGPYQNTGSQYPNVDKRYTQNQNSQNGKTVQKQNQNSKFGQNQNTIITTGQIHNADSWNDQNRINPNTGIITGRISNGQTKHLNQNSVTDQREITNKKIEPFAILGKQSTSTQLPYNNHEYLNPYYSQQNKWSINGSQHYNPNQNTFRQSDNIVVTNNPYCTQIAKELIEKGGNVREVFIATSLCEGLVHPMDSGLGGGFQAVYYNFENNQQLFIDSREKSPSSTKFTKSSTKIGGNSIAIPSVLAGYESLYNIDKGNNRLKWSEIIQPVLTLCQNGYFMSRNTKEMIGLIIESYNRTEVHENKLKIPKFCDTLTQISQDGPSSSMYRANGLLHRLLVQDLRSVKSAIASKDIQNYRVKIRQPAITSFEKYRVYSTKAPGSGQAILFALKIIERLRKVIPSTATADEKMVYLLKILKYTYTLKPHLREISEYEINKIINEASQSLADGIVKAGFKFKSTIPTKFGDVILPKLQTSPSEGTTNIVIKIGKSAITASSSIGSLFGSGIFSENMGFFYNNHLSDFSNPNWRRGGKSLKNVAGPNKVTSSTISPVIMVDVETGEPVFQIGSAGGSHILSAIINTCFNYFILNRSLSESVSACRIMPKLVYSQNEITFSYECINNEHSFFNTDTAKLLRRIGVGFKFSKTAGHAAVTTFSKLRPGDPEAVFDKRRGGLSFIK